MSRRPSATGMLVTCLVVMSLAMPTPARSQSTTQQNDKEYTRLIGEYLRDSRITTELVDHLPASSTVPTPLKFNGRIVGTPGELTYAADIHRYLEAIADASPRATIWSIGKTEEGRDMMLMAIADEETIANLQRYKGMLGELTDPRRTSETRARELIGTAKPIYWITSGMHSPETGGPEMLMELAYRLVVEETPFIQDIRNNIITFITPVIEVDGREKEVDTYYFNKKRGEDAQRLPLMYWGKYVAHDDNRDGMGQFLALTRNTTRTFNEWKPTILHDLHEAQSYLYSSTGTGPYNEQLDPITVNEWWMLAEVDVMEMTKRGVPGVWTYGFYDGWTPNYLFFIAHTHNALGRFYEVQSYGPDNRDSLRLPSRVTSREWFRPNPPLPLISWGPRNNTNIQESALLFSLHHVGTNRQLYLENYWLKNKRSVERGRAGPTFAWVIPANQRRKADAADAVNELRRQGLEVQTANSDFDAGDIRVHQGDYVIRADQPYRTLADMYFSLQNFAPANPRPYDDTGWTFQLMRNVTVTPVADSSILTRKMTMLASDAHATGGIQGNGNVLVVDHTTDNNLMAFRYKHAQVRMLAAEADFELSGHQFRAGAFVIPDANRAQLEPSLRELGLSAWAVASAPSVATHEMDLPRIGYVHSWQRTQDEGWVRAALDTYGVPYDYFADQRLRDGNLRARYDVIIFPHVGGDARSEVNGIEIRDSIPLPYKRTDATPNLGRLDESDDIRGGMGLEGLLELAKFVEEGGTLIVEGATSTIFPEYGLTSGVSVEDPERLFLPGSIVRGVISDAASPIAYGYSGTQLPVYTNGEPILNAGGGIPGGFARFFGGGGPPGVGQNTTPMASRLQLSPWEQDSTQRGQRGARRGGQPSEMAEFRQMARAFGLDLDNGNSPRVVMKFPANAADILLSGSLVGGDAITNRAQVVDAPLGEGHVVMFSIRPFWRWQTQGTFFLGFNAILNWNDLDAGRTTTTEMTDGAASGSMR
jgi:Zinc carboxypeptidase